MKYMNEKELAERWKCTIAFLQQRRHRGQLPSYTKLGSLVRYSLDQVEAFEVTNEVILH
jgi:hypothetical protein